MNSFSKFLYLSFLSSLIFVLFLFAAPSARMQGQPASVAITSAAGYNAPVAPDSIAAAFGAKLATKTAVADAMPLPTSLGGTTVKINGEAAPLIFVSPTQVNFLIPSGIPAGQGQVAITAGDGAITTGAVRIADVAPSLFTANSNGAGPLAAVVLRVKADGRQSYESLVQYDEPSKTYATRAVAWGEEGDQLFLVLFLTGVRNAAQDQVRVNVGGVEYAPSFVGAVPGLAGLDQINLPLPREFRGRGRISVFVRANGYGASNAGEFEVGSRPATAGLQIESPNETVLAGETLELSGTGFAANPREDTVLFVGDDGIAAKVEILAVNAGAIRVRVPFGVATGTIKVLRGREEASAPVRVRASISGFVEEARKQDDGQIARMPIAGARVRLLDAVATEAVTDEQGSFVLPIASDAKRAEVEILPPSNSTVPSRRFALRLRASGDTPLPRGEEQSASGSVPFPLTADASESGFTLSYLEPGRTPTNLPIRYFSTRIARIAPFGQPITPGAKLSFPNDDGIPAGAAVKLFKLDQMVSSETLGQFVEIGAATVTADGQRVETAANAITEGGTYFVSVQRPVATISGRVVERDGRAVPNAIIQLRGQSTFTDGNGGFVLRYVPVMKVGDRAKLEVSAQRPNGRIARKDGVEIELVPGDVATINAEIVLEEASKNFPPVIVAPSSLSLQEGESRSFDFVINDPDSNEQPGIALAGTASAFTTWNRLGGSYFQLILSPDSPGSFTLSLAATDKAGEGNSQNITVIVYPKTSNGPRAQSQSVTTAEDTPRNITLSGVDPSGRALSYVIVTPPARGILSGTAPTLLYTPARDFNGADSFTFKIKVGNDESRVETVHISISSVNDLPVLTVPGPQIADAGEPISFVVTATDVDGEDDLKISAENLPQGATFIEAGGTSRRFLWTPAFEQSGLHSVRFAVTDHSGSGVPKNVNLSVGAKWAKTSGPAGGAAAGFISNGKTMFTVIGGSIYRSTDQGRNWVEIAAGVTDRNLSIVFAKGSALIAVTQSGISFGSYVFRSTDNGQSWKQLEFQLPPNSSVNGIGILGNRIFIGVGGAGVFASDDDGETWRQKLGYFNGDGGISGVLITSLAVSGKYVLAAGSEDIFRSADGGETWQKITNVPKTEFGNVALGQLRTNGEVLLAIGNRTIYRSNNHGESWVRSNAGLENGDPGTLVVNEKNFFVTALRGLYVSESNGEQWTQINGPWGQKYLSRVSALNGVVYASTSEELYRSADQGKTWAAFSLGLTISTVYEVTRAGDALWARTPENLHRSFNGGQSWTRAQIAPEVQSVWYAVYSGATIFAVTDVGIYRSLDQGRTWTYANIGSKEKSASIIAVSEALLFARQIAQSGEELYRSTDNGQTWTRVGAGLESVRTGAIYRFGATLLTTSNDGVYRSEDNGQTWTASNEGIKGLLFHRIEKSGAYLIASGSTTQIYRSADNGRSWTKSNTGLPDGPLPIMANDGRNLFISFLYFIYRSTDNGQNWSLVGPAALRGNITVLKFSGANLYAVTRDAGNGANSGIWLSPDGGETWREIGAGLSSKYIHSLAIAPEGLYAGTENNGVYRLTNSSQTWTARNAGVNNPYANSLVARGADLFVGTFGGVFRSADQGQTWSPSGRGLPQNANVQSIATNGASLWAAVSDQGVYHSTDGGANWTASNQGLSDKSVNRLFVNGSSLYAGTDGGVFRSNNGGASWSAINGGLANLRAVSFTAYHGVVFAGTDGGIFRLNAEGQNWETAGRDLGNLPVTAMMTYGDALYAGTNGGGIAVSRDDGETWTMMNDGLPENLNVFAFASSGRSIYAGTAYGIFVSEDEAQTWRQRNAGLSEIQVTGLSVSGELLFVSTARGGVFSSRIPQSVNTASAP